MRAGIEGIETCVREKFAEMWILMHEEARENKKEWNI